VSTNNSIDGRFTFGLKFRDTRTRIAELTSESFRFELSFGVLARGPVSLARQTLGLLR
jgi:hypothetical protein